MSLQLAAVLTSLISPLLCSLNARMAQLPQLPQVTVNGRDVDLTPMDVPPNAPS